MTANRERLKQNILELMDQLILCLRPSVSEEGALTELTMPQLRTLLHLQSQGPLRMSDLATRLGVGMPTASSLVGKLEEKNLVTREHDTLDRRVVICHVTGEGKEEAERFWRVKKGRMNTVMDMMNNDELELMTKALQIFCRAASSATEMPANL